MLGRCLTDNSITSCCFSTFQYVNYYGNPSQGISFSYFEPTEGNTSALEYAISTNSQCSKTCAGGKKRNMLSILLFPAISSDFALAELFVIKYYSVIRYYYSIVYACVFASNSNSTQTSPTICPTNLVSSNLNLQIDLDPVTGHKNLPKCWQFWPRHKNKT